MKSYIVTMLLVIVTLTICSAHPNRQLMGVESTKHSINPRSVYPADTVFLTYARKSVVPKIENEPIDESANYEKMRPMRQTGEEAEVNGRVEPSGFVKTDYSESREIKVDNDLSVKGFLKNLTKTISERLSDVTNVDINNNEDQICMNRTTFNDIIAKAISAKDDLKQRCSAPRICNEFNEEYPNGGPGISNYIAKQLWKEQSPNSQDQGNLNGEFDPSFIGDNEEAKRRSGINGARSQTSNDCIDEKNEAAIKALIDKYLCEKHQKAHLNSGLVPLLVPSSMIPVCPVCNSTEVPKN